MRSVSLVFTLAMLSATRASIHPLLAAQATSPSTVIPIAASFNVTSYAEPQPSRHFTAAKIGSSEKNITYCIADGVELKLNISYPTGQSTQMYPLVVWIHGGGLTGPNMVPGPPGRDAVIDMSAYTARGYAFASIAYRLGPRDKLPTMIEDAKCAIRYLRARAGAYNINPDRIGVIGASSGGYLAAMLGLADASAGFEGLGAFRSVSSRVQAVVALYPQVSFEMPSFSDAETDSRNAVIPANAGGKFLRNMSLQTYVSQDDPPFLFFHGEFDAALSPMYSRDLSARLVASGVDSTYVLVKRAGHGWLETSLRLPNTPYGPDPSTQEILMEQLDFFDQHLKK